MRNLTDYVYRCIDDAEKIGLPLGRVMAIDVNRHFKKCFGRCQVINPTGWEQGYKIECHPRLLEEETPERLLFITIFHELVHTIDGCMNHGAKFKKYAACIQQAYGYEVSTHIPVDDDVKRVAGLGEYGTYKYHLICNGCGYTVHKHRACFVTKHPEVCHCKRCGNTFRCEQQY